MFKADVCKRIETPLLKSSQRDLKMLAKSLDKKEMALSAHQLDNQKRMVEENYQYTLDEYWNVIDRLKKYEPKFLI
jgi:hypothetical protein